ncbi:uncharacterized protein [Amphiura filiformis]|uniref:uncharacterized protein n=1 Tax=Amphiura filiformis TaxID=82378 RepID=UPI003B2235B5
MDGLIIVVFLSVAMIVATKGISSVNEDARGREFVFAFPTARFHPTILYEPLLQIRVTSASDTTVSINTSFPDLVNQDTILTQVFPGEFIVVDLPPEVIADRNKHHQNGTVLVQTDGDISIVANSYFNYDVLLGNLASFNVLPTSALSTEYVIVDWPSSADYYRAEFVITSLHDETNIRYNLKTTPIIPGPPKEAVIHLQRYETVQFQVMETTGRSLSGSRIWSDKPISVVAGCECADVLFQEITCDYVAIHLIPFDKWGLVHYLTPFAGRESTRYVVRIAAGRDDTSVKIGNSYPEVRLNAGEVHEEVIATEDILKIAGTKPIFVVQFAPSHFNDVGDSLMLIIPPIEQYINETISVVVLNSSAYQIETNYLSIHTGCPNIDGLLFDGVPLDSSWMMVNASNVTMAMCAAQNTITSGQHVHNISHVSADALITAMLYGFGNIYNAVSYGYAAGFGLEKKPYCDTNSTIEVLCQTVDVRCPNDTIVYTEPGANYSIVSWPPVAANGSSSYIDITCDHKNGGKFDIGQTIVACVEVEFGYAEANCFFQVTVLDKESPVFNDCPADISDIFAFENETVPICWDVPDCKDNSGEKCILSVDFEPGNMFSFGKSTVSYLAKDASNNEASCNFTITIIPRCRASETVTPVKLTWPDANVKETVESFEKCSVSTTRRGLGYGIRTCAYDSVKGAVFQEPVFVSDSEPCGAADDVDLQELAKTPVAESIVEEVAEALANLTENQDAATLTVDTIYVSTTIQNIVNIGSASSQVTTSVIDTVDNILIASSSPPQENNTQASNSSSQIVRSLEKQIALTLSEEGAIKVVEPSIAVQSSAINETTRMVGFVTTSSNVFDKNISNVVTFVNQSYSSSKMIQSSISLPSSFTTGDSMSSGVNVSFLVFQSDTLFVSQNISQSDDLAVVGAVLSADVSGVNTTDVTEPLQIEMTPFKRCITDSNVNSTRCVTWDFFLNDGIGDWSEEGCEFVEFRNGRVVCQCYHFANFAAIAGISIRDPVIDIVSIVGCSLSLTSVLIMLAIFSRFKKLRQSQPRQINMHLCFSLFCLYLTFIIIFAIDNHTSYDPKCPTDMATWQCITSAVFLHYFTLTTVMWMGVEAQLLYKLLVIIFGQKSSSFIKYARACAWGIPAIIVSISLGAGWDKYERLENCFVSEGALYLSLAIPIAVVLSHNLIVFVLILRSLVCRVQGKVQKHKSPELWRRLRQSIGITLLLGLTWLFGIFAIQSATRVFGWLFVLFNAFQGTGIFVFFCVLQDDVRMALAPYFECVKALKRRGEDDNNPANQKPPSPNNIPLSSASLADDNHVDEDGESSLQNRQFSLYVKHGPSLEARNELAQMYR